MPQLPSVRAPGGWGRAMVWPPGARWRGVVALSVIFCAYVGTVSLKVFLDPDSVALLWLPNGVLVTAMLWFRLRDWPYVVVVGLLAELAGDVALLGVAPYKALYLGAVNGLEASLFVLCAALIAGGRRKIGLLSVRGAWSIVLSAIAVPVVTGALGAVGVGWAFGVEYLIAWRSWWFGDSLGLLVGVPTGLLLRDAARSAARRRATPLVVGGGGAAMLLLALSATLAATGNVWQAQQTAIATAVLLSLTFGAIGAPIAAVLVTAVTLISPGGQDERLAFVVGDQALLFVVFAAFYAIAAAIESADYAMDQLARFGNDLEAATARFSSLLEATPDALIAVGADGRILLANAQTDRVFGYSRDALIGSEVEMLIPSRFRGGHIRHRERFFAEPAVRPMGAGLQLWGLRRDGTEFPVAVSLSPLRTGRNVQVLAAIRDITERHRNEQRLRRQHEDLVEAQQELRRLAHFDSVTGLANRAGAFARLEAELQCSRDPGVELGVLFCDVDNFKTVNDSFGHVAGDVVLATQATRIRECLRQGDTAGRIGGDEILVLLPGLHSLEEAAQIAETIRLRAAEPIHHSGATIHATLSIGATLAIPGETVSDLTTRVDATMYQAKHAGRNRVTCA